MRLYPAIDLRAGRCVRLLRGNYDAETHYGDDPVAQAEAFAAAGADWIHVVDLDAARSGNPVNRGAIEAICDAVDVPVQSGGGVRDLDAASALAEAGVARVVIGTAALENPELVAEVSARQPVAVGLDARGRDLAGHGWEVASGQDLVSVARRFAADGVEAFVITEIDRDGTLDGPSFEQLAIVLGAVGGSGAELIASGGVGRIDDLVNLQGLCVENHRLGGAIVGRALYEGAFGVAEAIEALSEAAGRAGSGR